MSSSPNPRRHAMRAWPALIAALAITWMPAHAGLVQERGPDGRMRLRQTPDDRPKYQYACLWTKAGVDSAESQITAHTLEEATGYATYKFGDYPVKCRELKEGGQLAGQKAVSPQSHPFSGLSMGDYFDAIYNGDRFEVRRHDKQYIGKMVSDLKGGFNGNPIWAKIMGGIGIDKATLIVPVIREYMRHYDSVYAACLRRDAVSFTTVQTTTRNGVAVESRETGVFRVNREFAAAYKSTFDSNPTVGAAIGDMRYGSPVARAEDAVRAMMGTRRCNDPVIKQFETRLLELLGEHQAGRLK